MRTPMSGEIRTILAGIDPAAEQHDRNLTYRQLLGRRLLVNSWVRFAVAASFILGAVVADRLLNLTSLAVAPLTGIGIGIAVYNVVVFFISREYQSPERSAGAFDRLRLVMYAAIVLDFLALASAVFFLGGARSPVMTFYMLHVTLSCVMLTRRAAISFTALAYALVAVQVVGEWLAVPPFDRALAAGNESARLDGATAIGILLIYGILFTLTDFLLITVADWLRHDERELRAKNVQLDELSRLRRDFLHVALHNLKSPIGASMMLLDNLRSELAGPLSEKQQAWVDRCYERLDGLSRLLNDLQILGQLETEEVGSRMSTVDLRPLLREVVEEYEAQARSRRHSIASRIPADLPFVVGIDRLLREAVANYITNAIKYTPEGGVIEVSASRVEGRGADRPRVRIEVRDTGIGIDPEQARRLFGEFVRLRTGSRQDEPIPGTGLGLSIVKRIVEAHGGTVGVESAPNEGSTFYIKLPAV